jgi:hypothetical protein
MLYGRFMHKWVLLKVWDRGCSQTLGEPRNTKTSTHVNNFLFMRTWEHRRIKWKISFSIMLFSWGRSVKAHREIKRWLFTHCKNMQMHVKWFCP